MPGYFHVWQLSDGDDDWEDEEGDDDDLDDEDDDWEDDDEDDDDWDEEEEGDEYPGVIADSVEDLLEAVREWASSPQGALMVEWRTDEEEDEEDDED